MRVRNMYSSGISFVKIAVASLLVVGLIDLI